MIIRRNLQRRIKKEKKRTSVLRCIERIMKAPLKSQRDPTKKRLLRDHKANESVNVFNQKVAKDIYLKQRADELLRQLRQKHPNWTRAQLIHRYLGHLTNPRLSLNPMKALYIYNTMLEEADRDEQKEMELRLANKMKKYPMLNKEQVIAKHHTHILGTRFKK